MNLDANPTIQELQELLRRCDDRAGHHVLWVSKAGDVAIARLPKNEPAINFNELHPEMQMRCETFLAGNEYVGPEAAESTAWVAELLDSLLREWGRVKGTPAVGYADQYCWAGLDTDDP
ncbi:MAG TPA: hypothetical protein VEL76_33950 [Gemmataceae bacterium]|nr:hypothetical protein [Gemmataceae bacterium]